jgi:hypothetical protein
MIAQKLDAEHLRNVSCKPRYHAPCIVAGAVIDEDDLEGAASYGFRRRLRPSAEFAQAFGFVVAGRDDGKLRLHVSTINGFAHFHRISLLPAGQHDQSPEGTQDRAPLP